MNNLYFFRNVQTNKVLVSPTYVMNSAILQQIGEHRYGNKIRPDLWVPFIVLSGLKKSKNSQQLSEFLLKQTVPFVHKNPLAKERLPVLSPSPRSTTHFWKWKIPQDVKEKSVLLCEALNSEKWDQLFLKNGEQENDTTAKSESSLTSSLTDDVPELTLFWEREEYKDVVIEKELMWPDYVQHEKLKLRRGRFPEVPGLDLKRLQEKMTLE